MMATTSCDADPPTTPRRSDELSGRGQRLIEGGDGTDTFVYFADNSNGNDAIEDFESAPTCCGSRTWSTRR